jgi:hypothetical protein
MDEEKEEEKKYKRASMMSDGPFETEGRMITQNDGNAPINSKDKPVDSARDSEHSKMYNDQDT